jgi:hypothetical protein
VEDEKQIELSPDERATPALGFAPITFLMKRLYIDLDGVLLVRIGNRITVAAHAADFLEFALGRFDCFWCTADNAVDSQFAVESLLPVIPRPLIDPLSRVKPAPYSILKTEAMSGDFYWIEDSPIAAEISDLCRRGALDRWIEINTRVKPDDLLRATDELIRALSRHPAPPRIPTLRHRTDFACRAAAN